MNRPHRRAEVRYSCDILHDRAHQHRLQGGVRCVRVGRRLDGLYYKCEVIQTSCPQLCSELPARRAGQQSAADPRHADQHRQDRRSRSPACRSRLRASSMWVSSSGLFRLLASLELDLSLGLCNGCDCDDKICFTGVCPFSSILPSSSSRASTSARTSALRLRPRRRPTLPPPPPAGGSGGARQQRQLDRHASDRAGEHPHPCPPCCSNRNARATRTSPPLAHPRRFPLQVHQHGLDAGGAVGLCLGSSARSASPSSSCTS